MKTAVVYWSGTGNTEAMAKAVAEGMTAAGAEAERHTQYEHGAYQFLHPHHHYALFTPNGGRDGRRGGAFSSSRL